LGRGTFQIKAGTGIKVSQQLLEFSNALCDPGASRKLCGAAD